MMDDVKHGGSGELSPVLGRQDRWRVWEQSGGAGAVTVGGGIDKGYCQERWWQRCRAALYYSNSRWWWQIVVPVCHWEDAGRFGPDAASGLVWAKSVTSMLGNNVIMVALHWIRMRISVHAYIKMEKLVVVTLTEPWCRQYCKHHVMYRSWQRWHKTTRRHCTNLTATSL